MMERASRNRQNAQMEQMRALQLRQAQAMEPLVMAKMRGDIVKAKTDYDSALKVQDYRSQAYGMWDTAQDDFNFVNAITDDKVRAQASREWLSRYSQLANISDIAPQVKQMRDLAVDNINTTIKLNMLGSADMRSFNALIQDMTPEEQMKAKAVKAGLQARPSGAAIQYREVIGADGVARLVAVDPRAVGARVIGTGEGYGSGVGPVGTPPEAMQQPGIVASESAQISPAPRAQAQPAQTSTGDQGVFASQTPYQKARDVATGTKDAEFDAQRRLNRPKRQAALRQAEVAVDRMSNDIDKLISEVNNATAGAGGVLLDKFPGSSARDLQANLDSIKANLGFQALQAMRDASPTGGALGQVSERENLLLQSTLGSLEIGQSPTQLVENLKKVKRRLAENYGLARSAFDDEFQGTPDSTVEAAGVGTSISEMSDVDLQARLRQLQGK